MNNKKTGNIIANQKSKFLLCAIKSCMADGGGAKRWGHPFKYD